VRPNNEDAYFAGPRLLAVADGVGGHAAGEVASATIIEALAPLGDWEPGYDLVGRLLEAVVAGNAAIAQRVAEDSRLQGMSTTLTAILFAGLRYCLLNIGDSRTYLLRDGSLEQITRDDSYVQLLVDEGHITQEAAGSHPQRNLVLQALTGEEVMEPAMTVREARAGDRFLLCSDGLSDVVDHAALAAALGEGEPQEAVARLIALALENRTRDNVTAIVADVIEGSRRLGLGQPAAQLLAQLVGVVLVVLAPPPGDDDAGRRHAGEAGQPHELPGDLHGRVGYAP
jgi:protein phosphatase